MMKIRHKPIQLVKRIHRRILCLMSQFQSKQFKVLQHKWYKKIKDQGFDDVEDVESPREFMKDWHSMYFQKRYTIDSFQAKEEYYRMARSFSNTHKFECRRDKQIWELHCEGLSLRKIAEKLKTKICRIHKVIKTLSQIMLQKA